MLFKNKMEFIDVNVGSTNISKSKIYSVNKESLVFK